MPQANGSAAPSQHQPLARDSLELGSLASSSRSPSSARSSSPSGAPSSRRLSFADDDDPLNGGPKQGRPARPANRSYSVSSAFDFAAPLLPLTSTGPAYTSLDDTRAGGAGAEPGRSLEKQKTLTFLNGVSLVVGLIIGSGIFSSPSHVNRNAGSPGASLIVWLVAGLLAWTGASSYVELGGAIPLNGGPQVYLAKIFGPGLGFLYSWCTVVVLKPGSAAIIAIIFGEYMVRAVIGPDARDASPWINKGAALAGLTLVTALNCVSTRVAVRSADVFALFKFVALLGITITGVTAALTGYAWDGRPSVDWRTRNWFDGTSSDPSRWAVAIYAGLWAFDGWDNANYVTGELINAGRNLPRVMHTSLSLVIAAFLLANTAYFLTLDLAVVETSQTIAVQFGAKMVGRAGSLMLALVVSGSCFGALNATTFTAGRLFHSAAREGYLPTFVGRLAPGVALGQSGGGLAAVGARLCGDEETQLVFATPVAALLLNYVMTAAYVVVGSFDALITFYGVAGYLFYFLVVLGLLVLRVREPQLERPYSCWITTPIIFCCVSLFLLSRSIVARPLVSLAVVPFLLVGLIIYLVKVAAAASRARKRRMRRSGRGGSNREGATSRWKFWQRRGAANG